MEWIHGHNEILWQLAGFSLSTFVVSVLLVPYIVIKLPAEYFSRTRRSPRNQTGYRGLLRFLILGKNALGILLILSGIAMLVLPGQGLLTMIVGLMLTNFPGKYHVEQWAISRPSVLRSMNWIRAKANKPPLVVNSAQGH